MLSVCGDYGFSRKPLPHKMGSNEEGSVLTLSRNVCVCVKEGERVCFNNIGVRCAADWRLLV